MEEVQKKKYKKSNKKNDIQGRKSPCLEMYSNVEVDCPNHDQKRISKIKNKKEQGMSDKINEQINIYGFVAKVNQNKQLIELRSKTEE